MASYKAWHKIFQATHESKTHIYLYALIAHG